MDFSSLFFLCAFFPIVLILYYLIPSLRAKNMLLILTSLLFYAYGEPIYVFLMIFSTVLNYIFGLLVGKRKRKSVLIISVIVNVGMLAVFKYTDMFIGTVNSIFGTTLPLAELWLPIGISFFTFQAMSYVIDIYRDKVEAQKNYFNVLLYVSLFPQLMAGPIVRYADIQAQISSRKHDIPRIAAGFRRFICGLAKKVLIANTVGAAADVLFALPMGEINMLSAWVAAIAYMLQIYYDFGGYSDMAIGLAKMFGFEFLENFRHPYSALSIQDFWRRWHISLSTWFKDYLYIPLGGNRKGKSRTLFNKLVVFATTGLWHGANWSFVVWGLFHGAFLILEDILPIRKMNTVLRRIYTLLVVCIGFVIFRANNLTHGLQMIGKMFAGLNFTSYSMALVLEQITPIFIFAVIVGIIASFPIWTRMKEKISAPSSKSKWIEPATYTISLVALVLCLLNLSGGTYNPFIYFRF